MIEILPALAFGLALIAACWRWRQWRPRIRRARLSGRRATVYVFQDRADPSLFKVGVTARLSKTRKREVSSTMAGGAPLRQVLALDMPHARTVETLAHRRLRPLRDRSGRGREWYRASSPEDVRYILASVEAAANDVRCLAMRRGKWSERDEESARRWQLTEAGAKRARAFGEART